MPNFTPRFDNYRELHLAGIRRWHTFDGAPKTVPPQWQEFDELPYPGRAEARVTYGATCQVDQMNHRFEYISAYEVPDFSQIPEDAGRMIVPAAHYAVFPLESVAQIPALWQYIFNDWMKNSGRKPANSPDFERVDERFDPAVRGPLELWLPVEP